MPHFYRYIPRVCVLAWLVLGFVTQGLAQPLATESGERPPALGDGGHYQHARFEVAGVEIRYSLSPSVLSDSEVRRAKIINHLPRSIETSPTALLPPFVRVEALRIWAILLETVADDDAARDAYARCIGLGLEDASVWRGLARTRLRSGDLAGAEAAWLAGYELLLIRESSESPALEVTDLIALRVERSQILQELGELYLLTRRTELAASSFGMGIELRPSHERMISLYQRAEADAAGTFTLAERTQNPLWPETKSQHKRSRIEHALRAARSSLPPALQRPVDAYAKFILRPGHTRYALLATLGIWLTISLLRRFRGHGDLVVAIDFPAELRGRFSVRLATSPGQYKRKNPQEREARKSQRRLSSHREHHLVNRETQFLRQAPGPYYVVVEGELSDPENDEVILDAFEEHSVEIHNDQTARVEFDFQPRECPVDVRVLWDKQPAENASVAARGQPQSMRFAKEGATRLRLSKGRHTIVVGSGDRVAEREIEVESFQPKIVVVDLAGAEGVIFKGCPPAVKPYVHGDLNAAARALARDGHGSVANLLLARLHCDQGQRERAAEYYHAAGLPLEAAELRAKMSDFSGAALLFREAGETARSAQMFRAAGEWIRAGEAYESIRDHASAVECFRESGDTLRWLNALESKGDFFEAARIALDQGDRARAIRLLQQVGINDLYYGEACELLADAFEHEGHADLAVQKLEQRISAGGGSPELHYRLADLLEDAGEFDHALQVFEKLRDEAPTFPNVAGRIESLRKKLSTTQLASSDSAGPSRSAPTSFLAETRYKIIDELGRGGMGVVMRAKDLRLDREVALKRLPDNLRDHPKAIQLFMREAQACARLNHRNIVTIYDTDQEDNNFFITMELLTGYPLNVIRRKKGRLAVRDVARIGVQVAEGLHYAHSRQIVHRDIKTANLFFTTDKIVKIMDFGLAKMMEEVRRGTTVLGGTPYYMAPEQAAGDQVDHRSDLYALGVTFFELVTGRVPFDDGDVAYHHRHTPPPDPRDLVPEIEDAMAELILDLLEKDPEKRCPSAAIVRQRLQAILSSCSPG